MVAPLTGELWFADKQNEPEACDAAAVSLTATLATIDASLPRFAAQATGGALCRRESAYTQRDERWRHQARD